ncbi:heparan-alpha-glucosaminide N-acetyltransferase domain-containing protein [Arachidicoccus terrestris]|uniref:heparan-alpha-glucosaminide N-acetyltransferase domain-containing protein n=1 Tax=Arachidicoccus terrestris TaxID=2875539 RepID=UPI001CC4736A|nr:heparan-alpha-glucosaminide N-acetyltransferase domain-containing protein [Arachidicoccus terrestris]UAY55728.1 DUF1624 domain-containing protein [Arachidicoccus terrestris]
MRIQSLDLTRGFTVLFIAPIHAVLLFASPTVYNTWLVQFLRFIAEGPGAQLFMLLMGISFVLGREKNPKDVLKRVGVLLLAGYTLNFLKFVLPAMLNILPAGVYVELQVERGVPGYFEMLFSGDILHFAALAYGLIYWVTRLRRYPQVAALLALLICLLSPLCYDLHNGNGILDYLLQLLGGQPPRIFFPLFPWLVYPLAGLVIGHYIKKGSEMIFGYAAILGLILLLFSCSDWMPFHYLHCAEVSFYRTYPDGTFYHLGLVLIWLYLWHLIATRHPHRILTKFLSFLSRRITLIYLVQWPLICWSLPLIGFRSLGVTGSILVAMGFGAAAIIISCIYLLLKNS